MYFLMNGLYLERYQINFPVREVDLKPDPPGTRT